jgi:ATP-dependent Clp protease protease subunit
MDKKRNQEHGPMIAPLVRGYTESYVKMSKARSVFLAEDITDRSAAELSALLLYYDHMDHEEPIHLYLHSNGGAITGLLNIYDVMQMVEAPVKTILLGKCYSAGAIILAAGAKDERYALSGSRVMIHGVQFVFPVPGEDMTNSKNYLEFVEDTNDLLMKILSKHTGQSVEKLKTDCAREYWMSAKEAQEYGLIDHIV